MAVRQRVRRSLGRVGDERGQAVFLTLVFMPMLMVLAMLAMGIAIMLAGRESAQRAADAAALAGCYDLPNTSQATTDATTYGASSGGLNASTTANLDSGDGGQSVTAAYSQKAFKNDTITVNVSRSQPLLGSAAYGFAAQTITAAAKCQHLEGSITICNTSADAGCFPYIVASTYGSSCTNLPSGAIVLFRDNGWVGDTNVNNCGWNVGSNNLKGFLNQSPTLSIGTDTVKGGNTCGQEPTSQLQTIAASSNPIIWLPYVTLGSGNGANINITVQGFIALSLSFTCPASDTLYPSVPYPHPGGASQPSDYTCPGPFFGQVVSNVTTVPTGGTINPGVCTPSPSQSCVNDVYLIQ